jgi:hypothetical protein
MRLPNFFIIGAAKCSTTSLAEWLRHHPKIYISALKEPQFFSKDINTLSTIRTWAHYYRLFQGASPKHLAIGEASVTYLFSKVAVPAIETKLPGSKYIVMIRNPVDMAYALHEQMRRVFNENVNDFYEAWRLAPERRMGHFVPPGCPDPKLLDYPSWCLLGEQLERLFALVSRERVLVLVLDDVKENPRREYLLVLEFLQVPDDGRQEFPVYNSARGWRSQSLGKLLNRLFIWAGWMRYNAGVLSPRHLGIGEHLDRLFSVRKERPPLSPEVRRELEAFFASDIQRLEHLLNRRFPNWYSVNSAVAEHNGNGTFMSSTAQHHL